MVLSSLNLVTYYLTDKVQTDRKDEAKQKFQDIAFAYAVLSDQRRRRRYDTTGNTSESLDLDDDDFNWVDFFKEQYAAVVTAEAIEKIKREYTGSDEERRDLLGAFAQHKGDMDLVYENVMLSNVVDDDERFRNMIEQAIESGEAKAWKSYKQESKVKRRKRLDQARKEAAEAEELADELGVKEKLFGKDSAAQSKRGKTGSSEGALATLIQQRQKNRAATFFNDLEAKYSGGKKVTRGRKRAAKDEPLEEAFERNAATADKRAKSARKKG